MSRSSAGPAVGRRDQLPLSIRNASGVLVVVAHPDDESFALGALLDQLITCGIDASVLCFTHGEASTLHGRPGDLAIIRAGELRTAAAVLGIERVELLDYPDGGLDQIPVDELADHVGELVDALSPTHLLVFDEDGVTGHPDHQQATRAALAAAGRAGLPVLAWTIPQEVADRLNERFGTRFQGHLPEQMDAGLAVSRERQRLAIAEHASQSIDNPVLHERLRLLGDIEYLRILLPAAADRADESGS